MSQGKNHRRPKPSRKGQDNGPTFEGPTPSSGCNSTHVAKCRTDWSKMRARGERRNGQTPGSFRGGRPMQNDSPDDDG